MQSLKDKVVFITGGAGGIGMGMARAFSGQGAKVVLADLDPARLAKAAASLREAGATVMSVKLDVADLDDWAARQGEVERAFGPIDVLCNNAGVGGGGALTEGSVEEWRRVVEINLFGMYYGCRTVLPRMLQRDVEAHIVNTASLSGMTPHGGSAYVASKHGAVGLSEALRRELRGTKVGVSLVCPAAVNTDMSANSAQILGREPPPVQAAGNPHAAAMKAGLDPNAAGAIVVKAVLAGTFYVMTHPDARRFVEPHLNEILRSFGEPAKQGA